MASSVKSGRMEYYYSLDTNHYLNSLPLSKIGDSLKALQAKAAQAGNLACIYSQRLYFYAREFREHVVSNDTIEYRVLKLFSEAEEQQLTQVKADAAQLLGDVYSKTEKQSAAIEQYLLAYSIYKNFSEVEYPARQYNTYQASLIFYKNQDYSNSLKYLREAIQLNQVNGFKYFFTIANSMGLCYRNLKNYDSALFYFQYVIKEAVGKSDQSWEAIGEGNIGITYYYQKRYDDAVPFLTKDINFGLRNSNVKNAVNSMLILTSIYLEQGRNDESDKLLKEALAFCHQKAFWGDYSLAERVYEQLYRLNGRRKNFQLSSLYADSALMAKDSAAKRFSTLNQSQAIEKQNYIRRKLDDERNQSLAKITQAKMNDQQMLLYKFIIGFLIVVLVVALSVNRYRSNIKHMSTTIQDAPEIVVQKMSIVIISIATCAAALVWSLLYYFYYGLCPSTFCPIFYFVVISPSLVVYFITKRQQFLVNVQLVCIFVLPILMEFFNGGFQSGVVINWALLAPVGALMYKGVKEAAIWMLLFLLAIICTILFNGFFSGYYHPISETGRSMFYGMDILGPSIVIYFSMQFYVRSMVRDGRLLQKNNSLLTSTLDELQIEKHKSDSLLLNILPEEIAEELKLKGATTARYFDNVTVLFTDFVNFTEAGARMSPQELVDELDACFKAFDKITAKYNIEKIKTVGDAYLAVAGLPTPDNDHALNMVKAALEINAFMKDRFETPDINTFEVRIGIHSGSVVAGIVGIKKFAYDIWGDAVNTAARMEQNSAPGKVNISQTTYDIVKDKFDCAFRGEIEAKGKGLLKMYFVD